MTHLGLWNLLCLLSFFGALCLLIAVLVTSYFRAATRKQAQTDMDHFFNLSTDLHCIAGTDGYFKRVNPSFEKLLGYTASELTSRPYLDFVDPDDASITKVEARKIAKNEGASLSFENRYRCKDGRIRWLAWQCSPASENGILYANARDITDQKDQEVRLKVSEATAKATLDGICGALPQIVWTSTPEGNLDYYNQRWYDYTGLTFEQTKGWGWEPVIHPEDLKNCIDRWTHSYQTGAPYEVEYRFKRASDGQYRWHLGRALPIRDSEGKILKWYGSCTDIDDQKGAVEELHRTQQQVKTVLTSVPVVLWATDMDGVVTLCEGRGLGSLGIKPSERVGWNLLNGSHGDEASQNCLRRALAGESVHGVLSRATPSGEKWIETFYSPLLDSSGATAGVVAISNDITEQRNLRNELELSEERQRMALNAARIGHWNWDIPANKISYLGGLGSLYGRAENAPFSSFEDFLEIIHPEDRLLVAGTIELCLNEKTLYEIQYRVVWPDSTIHWLHGKGDVFLDAQGTPVRMTGVNIDITSQKELETAFRESDEKQSQLIVSERAAKEASMLKSEFLANMSHEIRTPINGVIGINSLLLDTGLTSEQKNYSETIRISAEILLTLVNDILDFSKAESGKIEIESIDFELAQVIQDIERTLVFSAQNKGLKLLKSVSSALPHSAKGDPTRLRQILLNLVNNAIKFTAKGQVTIEAHLEHETQDQILVRYEVTDTGIGIPAQSIDRMFEAFSQADASTTRRFGGTGLGLSISKHLVSLMGGAIGVKSKEGVGSTFWFTLPFQKSAICVHEMKPEEKIDQIIVKKLRILVAEDNPVNQLIAIKMLEKCGHLVVAVANGREAIQALGTASYDLVLMDCQMPELDGYQATRIIRESEACGFTEIPIIAMTANAMRGDREKCLDAGMDDYVSKPVKPKDLEMVIARTLAQKTSAA